MRYARLAPLDLEQDAVRDATVAVVGAGATGSRMLAQLARLGADIRIVDRDVLEEPNLATSALYTERQVEERLPKAVAARERLEAVTPDTTIDPIVEDLTHRNADSLLDGADIILDGTDNFETRHLINEWCVENDVAWVHVSALGVTGEVMPVVPGETACFNCVFGEVDGAALATCETAGIAPAAAATAASLGVHAATELLQGGQPSGLQRFDLDSGVETLAVERRESCTACAEHAFPYLDGEKGAAATRVCGEDAYQVTGDAEPDLEQLENRLDGSGDVVRNPYLLRFDGRETFTVFCDGRMLVEAASPEEARSIYARFVGS
ncbi:MAG: ThiF family adenylyltransferase [Candidatus Nanohaloarchaea archaeon]|nr:ThiF family adenylyltransferase [Candidatus Nanohaloarchaea archaeon]